MRAGLRVTPACTIPTPVRPPRPTPGLPPPMVDIGAEVFYPIRVEAAWGASPDADPASWVWSDITPWVRFEAGVQVKRGTPARAQAAESAEITMTLDGRDKRFSPGVVGPNYPYVRRTVPLRVAVGVHLRGLAYVKSWTVHPTLAGTDTTVTVEASGRLYREGQLRLPDIPATTRATRSVARQLGTCAGYWTLTDADGATAAASALPGGTPASYVGEITCAGFDTAASVVHQGYTPPVVTIAKWPGAGSIVDLSRGGQVVAQVATTGTAGWTVQCLLMSDPTANNTNIVPMEIAIAGGTYDRMRIVQDWMGGNSVRVLGRAAGVWSTLVSGHGITFVLLAHAVVVAQVGPNITVTLQLVDGSASEPMATVAGVAGTVQSVTINPDSHVTSGDETPFAAGHLSVWSSPAVPYQNVPTIDPITGDYAWPSAGYAGEAHTHRLARVAAEEGITVVCRDPLAARQTYLGIEPATSRLGVLQAVEAADGGRLVDGGVSAGIEYISRSQIVNRPTALVLDGGYNVSGQPTQGGVMDGLSSVLDDEQITNDVTVTRTGGSSVRATDAVSVAAEGDYETSPTANLWLDGDLADAVGWAVWQGAAPGQRIEGFSIDFRASPAALPGWLAGGVGARVLTLGPDPTVSDNPLDQSVDQYTELLRPDTWEVRAECSDASRWDVFVIGDPILGRFDTEASTVAADIGSGDVTVLVASPGVLWTTSAVCPADFPFDARLDGERVTVTAITGTSSPQTFTVTRSVNAVVYEWPAGTPVRLWTCAPFTR